MNTYLSHISAALLWEIPFLHVVLGYHDSRALEAASFVEQITARSEGTRKRRLTVESHVASLPLPKGAIVKLGGKNVASPELVFLELAPELGFHRAVLLGMQLCASRVGEKSITSASKIRGFLSKAKGHRGHKAASLAAKYIVDGSASIVESLLCMLLTLPNRWGGYGLTGASLNQRISLENRKTSLSNSCIFVDLLWSRSKLVVEYDSYQYHNNTDSWMKDARRLAAIERLGYKVMSINTAQLYNSAALEEVAYVIAKRLGKRIRIQTSRFSEAHSELRNLLPRATA